MEIIVNGESRRVTEGYTAARLVEELGLSGRRIAMEVNREIVPRSDYERHVFDDGDRVELVHAIGGG
ncbi:sulfur carrier protein ThiS [Thiohalomonas denitrificans]|uniref:Sulfur carrier protein n=1 Tax=Thiohalomonas denitrificans TaxID=415747 RepID=A0A1G5QSZ5_9GAMM|nr:sulfur carrier protein ThiS [Thiohalomonas denitrificans]SCZ64862.1 sulfur carrier protein [Thiohalomonas denitrificans]